MDIQIKDDRTLVDRITECIAEFFGTAILMYVGCMGCTYHDGATGRLLAEGSLAFGFAVLMAIQCFGHISGAHINPIITVGAVIRGMLPVIEVPIYFFGQFSGSIAGYGLIRLLLPKEFIYGPGHKEDGICANGVIDSLTPIQGLFIEFIISFILVTFACGVWDSRNSLNSETISLRFGFAVACLVFAAGPLTAAHMNPARTLGPVLLNNFWKHNWVFWVGPFSGSFVAAILYTVLYT